MNYILLLGGNIGERKEYIIKARDAVSKQCGPILQMSSIYETEAWGVENQQDFLNQIIVVKSDENPFLFLNKILQIELDLGRLRFEKWAERVIDIDILFIDNNIIESESLKVPHPEIQNRNFTLAPLVEIMPEFTHPQLNTKMTTLLEKCTDKLLARIFKG